MTLNMRCLDLKSELTGRVQALLKGTRKDGVTSLSGHSVNVGDWLVNIGCPVGVIFAGYYHDVPEDVESVSALSVPDQRAFLEKEARAAGLLDNEIVVAVETTMACCYTKNEYAQPKFERKRLAVKRWKHASIPVKLFWITVHQWFLSPEISRMIMISGHWGFCRVLSPIS